MNKGVLLFAHNNSQIDYSKLAIIAAKFAKKNLNVSVSLITDRGTKTWIETEEKTHSKIFDQIILIDETQRKIYQTKRFYDGSLDYKKSDFKNDYRSWAYELSPYEHTLVIDVDFLIVNDRLNHIWDTDADFMINRFSNDLAKDRDNFEFQRVSDHGIDFYWATIFYFKKTEWTKTFFNLCQHIVENYEYYKFVYRINHHLMRNDYVFSIAIHIMQGFNNKIELPSLPCEIYHVLDRDNLIKINNNKSFTFLIQKNNHLGEYTLAKTTNHNIHIMNKFSLTRHFNRFIEVIDE